MLNTSKHIWVIWLIFGVTACADYAAPPLPKEKMIAILKDIHIAEAKINRITTELDSGRVLMGMYEQQIYARHNVDEATYLKAFDYYMSEPQLMDEIYQQLIDTLALEEQIITSKSKNLRDTPNED